MAGTATLTSSVERRNKEPNIKSIWERVMTFTLTDSSGGDAITHTLSNMNGRLRRITVESGTAAGIGGTLTLAINDNRGNPIFPATAGPAEEAASVFNVDEVLVGDIDVVVDPNDDPTSGTWAIVVTLQGD